MGRLKTLASHSRNCELTITEKTIKYAIPIHETLGMFRGIEIADKEIRLQFDVYKTDEKPVREPSLKVDKTPKVIGFD